jgi:hypothetical protein
MVHGVGHLTAIDSAAPPVGPIGNRLPVIGAAIARHQPRTPSAASRLRPRRQPDQVHRRVLAHPCGRGMRLRLGQRPGRPSWVGLLLGSLAAVGSIPATTAAEISQGGWTTLGGHER